MDQDDPMREKFHTAALNIMGSFINKYTTKDIPKANWGDYFYMEALHRLLDSDWKLYW